MPCRIMLISYRAEFTIKTLTENLKEAGFDVIPTAPSAEIIEQNKTSADIILIYAGSFIETASDALIYIRDILCTVEKKALCVIGLGNQIDDIEKLIPPEMIKARFVRPFDMQTLVRTLKNLSSNVPHEKSGRHILVVDDDPMFLKIIREHLSAKFDVTCIKSGTQTIAYLSHHKPDLILLDYDMPVTSGPQVMQMIRSEPALSDIPIMFLTGNSDKESVMTVMQLKPQGYLLKSMGYDRMTERIDSFFDSADTGV